MIKRYWIVLILICFIFTNVTLLQAQAKKSLYSMFGVGQIIDNSYGINKSLGGTGIAFQSGTSINYLNPASYIGMLPNSSIMETGIYGIYNSSENNYISQIYRDINVSYFSTSIYLINWWAFSFGVVPFSFIDYEISSNDQIGGDISTYEKIFKGNGGLKRIYFGNSFRLYEGLTVGINTSYIFGDITETETAISTDSFTGYELKNNRTAYGFYLDYGIQYSVLYNDWLYSIGFIFGAGRKLNTTDDFEFTFNELTSPLEQDNKSTIEIPPKFGVGLSVKDGDNFRAGFDYEWKNWSNINFSNLNIDVKNSNRFSVGVEYSPYLKDQWYKKFYYRFGANYKDSYLEVENTAINSMGINVGVGIPYYDNDMFNISIEYGEEGTRDNGLMKNRYWVFYFNFSFLEFWGSKALGN